MKTHFVIPATAAAICLSSCATDPAILEKKKSTSIGRFGVIHNTAVAPKPAESIPQAQETASAPAPAPSDPTPTPEKKPFSWNSKKKESPAVASAPEEKPVPVKEAPAAPEKEYLLDSWFKKKEKPAPAPTPSNQTASAPTGKKRNVSVGRFGVIYSDAEETAAPAPAPEKKSRFSWFKRKNDTEGAPVAEQVQEKPAEKKAATASKLRMAKSEEPVEFQERKRSGGLSGDIRLPDMLNLPDNKDLKSSDSGTKKTGKEGAVISRPPVEEKKD